MRSLTPNPNPDPNPTPNQELKYLMRSMGAHVVVEPAASLHDVERAVGTLNSSTKGILTLRRYLPWVPRVSTLTTHYSPRTAHNSLLATRYFTRYFALSTHYLLLTTHHPGGGARPAPDPLLGSLMDGVEP